MGQAEGSQQRTETSFRRQRLRTSASASLDWYIREGLQGRAGSYLASPIVDAAAIPKKLEGSLEGYEEPVGTEFLKWKSWEKLMADCEEKISAARAAVEEAAIPTSVEDSDDADLRDMPRPMMTRCRRCRRCP